MGTPKNREEPRSIAAATAAGHSEVDPKRITDGERRVLVALARPTRVPGGVPATNRQIAAELFITISTVKGHLRSLAEAFDLHPLFIRIGLGGARRLVNTAHAHAEIEGAFALVDQAGDGCGALRVGRAGQGNVSLTREQSRGGIQADPARTRQVHLAPRMKIGEVLFRPARAVE